MERNLSWPAVSQSCNFTLLGKKDQRLYVKLNAFHGLSVSVCLCLCLLLCLFLSVALSLSNNNINYTNNKNIKNNTKKTYLMPGLTSSSVAKKSTDSWITEFGESTIGNNNNDTHLIPGLTSTSLAKKSTPTVGSQSSANLPSVKYLSSEDFPTVESPMRISRNW